MMRDYGKVYPRFWTGKSGKEMRGDLEAQVLALYLMTSPHANMIGVYYCPIAYMANETGMTIEGASKALQRLSEGEFCTFDGVEEVVWVHEMAAHQIGASLKQNDKQVVGISRQCEQITSSEIRRGFHARYKDDFHLRNEVENASPLQAPCKPLRSQEQEQEQELTPIAPDDSANRPDPKKPRNQPIEFDEHNGTFNGLNGQMAVWEKAYPAVSISTELSKAAAWLLANPKNKKGNYARFLTNWLARAQDKAPAQGGVDGGKRDWI